MKSGSIFLEREMARQNRDGADPEVGSRGDDMSAEAERRYRLSREKQPYYNQGHLVCTEWAGINHLFDKPKGGF